MLLFDCFTNLNSLIAQKGIKEIVVATVFVKFRQDRRHSKSRKRGIVEMKQVLSDQARRVPVSLRFRCLEDGRSFQKNCGLWGLCMPTLNVGFLCR